MQAILKRSLLNELVVDSRRKLGNTLWSMIPVHDDPLRSFLHLPTLQHKFHLLYQSKNNLKGYMEQVCIFRIQNCTIYEFYIYIHTQLDIHTQTQILMFLLRLRT